MRKPKVVLTAKFRRRLERRARRERYKSYWLKYQILLRADEGSTATEIARALSISRGTVYNTITRFSEYGEAGLVDRREENSGGQKADGEYCALLLETIEKKTPRDYGRRRPTWTLRLISEILEEETGIKLSPSQLSRLLRKLGARWGRAKPIVLCPWQKAARNRRIGRLKSLAQNVKPGEVVLYEDEVDIHLNPKIGKDWMVKGQQKKVVTPGKNQKRYIAGALDSTTRALIWVSGTSKNGALFIDLLKRLLQTYPNASTIHIILDNYKIHHSKQVGLWMAEFGGRIRFHRLPPYSPDSNDIERKWRDLHENVTINHNHNNIDCLMNDVEAWLQQNGPASVQTRRKAI